MLANFYNWPLIGCQPLTVKRFWSDGKENISYVSVTAVVYHGHPGNWIISRSTKGPSRIQEKGNFYNLLEAPNFLLFIVSFTAQPEVITNSLLNNVTMRPLPIRLIKESFSKTLLGSVLRSVFVNQNLVALLNRWYYNALDVKCKDFIQYSSTRKIDSGSFRLIN